MPDQAQARPWGEPHNAPPTPDGARYSPGPRGSTAKDPSEALPALAGQPVQRHAGALHPGLSRSNAGDLPKPDRLLVDTNVLLDLYKSDPVWLSWSLRQLQAGRQGPGLTINFVVYAELVGHPGEPDQLDTFLAHLGVGWSHIPARAAQLAGRAFNAYRQRGGSRTGVLPDFLIGAHALAEGLTLLTRDAGRYRTYFPGLNLICP